MSDPMGNVELCADAVLLAAKLGIPAELIAHCSDAKPAEHTSFESISTPGAGE